MLVPPAASRVAGIPLLSGGLVRLEESDGFVAYRSPLLVDRAIPHLFTTRRGGNAGAELDAGALDQVRHERVFRVAGIRPAARLAHAHQVHGDGVTIVEGRASSSTVPSADALVTSDGERALIVFTADCVPILVARADGTRVAAVHAGWRGLVAGVIPRTLMALGEGELVAAIGPCLSLARFEVGPEVADRFRAADLAAAVHAREGARPHVDLRLAARVQLERMGVRRIDVSDRCTWDDPELWSYRRDVTHGGRPRTGRLGALVAVRAGTGRTEPHSSFGPVRS